MFNSRREPGADPEDRDDLYGTGETFGLVMQRYSPRQVLKAGVVLSAVAVIGAACSSTEEDKPLEERGRAEGDDDGRLRFAPVPSSTADVLVVPAGYTSAVLIGWGDPLREADGTKDDPSGTRVLGMLNNCGGGTTPWGTVLTAEENFNQYFANQDAVTDPVLKTAHRRYGVPARETERLWERFDPRFDLAQEPNEAHRFGWIVEIDPFDAGFTPVKRTALGRFKHEAATVVLSRDNRAVVYTGDDERFDYVYKFVSDGRYDAGDRRRNLGLLDAGTLHVARFDDNGAGEWIPVRHGDPRLGDGFDSQAEVLIRVREAADRLGATKMDRPEDIETNPATGSVFMVMTNNSNRMETAPADRPGTGRNGANPRVNNRYGHVIEVREDGGDPAATRFQWSMFMLCGPKDDASRTFSGFPADQVSDIAAPDNLAFDRAGNMWIATDGQPSAIKQNDSLQAVATVGPDRGKVLTFLTGPVGAEVTGPCLTPDDRTLFVSIQHPGEGGTLAAPLSQWPDSRGYPRPSLAVVAKTGRRSDRKLTPTKETDEH